MKVREDKEGGWEGGVRLLNSEHGLDCSTCDVFPTEKMDTAWRREERKVGGHEPSCLRRRLHRGLSVLADQPSSTSFHWKACGLASYHLSKQKYRF